MAIRTGVEKPSNDVANSELDTDKDKRQRFRLNIGKVVESLTITVWVLELIIVALLALGWLMRDLEEERE